MKPSDNHRCVSFVDLLTTHIRSEMWRGADLFVRASQKGWEPLRWFWTIFSLLSTLLYDFHHSLPVKSWSKYSNSLATHKSRVTMNSSKTHYRVFHTLKYWPDPSTQWICSVLVHFFSLCLLYQIAAQCQAEQSRTAHCCVHSVWIWGRSINIA